MSDKQYVLGRGKVHFARFKPGTQVPDGFRYIGNTPEFSLSIESEELDHFSSDEGIREKDDSVPLEVNRTGSLTTDNIVADNVAMFFFGSTEMVTQTTVASSTETLEDINSGFSYRLGQTTNNPTGYFGISEVGFSVMIGATTLVEGTDYEMNYAAGVLTFLKSSSVATDGEDAEVTFEVSASTRARVISGSDPVEGAMMYITSNPKGEDCVFYLPYIKVTPNGDYALKGDDWQQIPMSLEVLKPNNGEAIYRDNMPVI